MAVYGGVCADDDGTARALLGRARDLSESLGERYLELRDGTRFPELPAKDLYVTFRREIDPDPEVNMARIPRNQRRSIRIALKHGLTHRLGGPELLQDFYRVYSHSVRNLGTPVFPRSLFASLMEELGDAGQILGVYHAGRMVAAVLTFFHRDQVLPYYGGALKEAFPLAVNDYMYWSLMGEAAARGCRVFDFGRSKRESGSYHFKRHWGFEPTPLTYQYHLVRTREVPDLSPRNPRFSLPIRVWKRLPLPLAEWLGPHIVRYFP
jgi:FemAB-related protein (PEP-CTERM system-associated)